MTTHEIRQRYLDFFVKHGHKMIASASLVPENDPSTLFTGSGMQPMVPFLLGEPHPLGNRIVDSQKCFRSQDIEEVGDNRHTTFFEMLGNWSLGDYFKREQISWMFAFLTKELGLDPNRLFVTAFGGNDAMGIPRDEETVQLWQETFQSVGIDAKIGERIFYYNEKKNWWSRSGVPEKMPVGEPGGPDTELFWDFGEALKFHEQSLYADEACHVNCDCGRYVEIGNNVFMQYQKTASGFVPLPKRNVDFGGGLERIAAAVSDDSDIFRIDVFDKARSVIERVAGRPYGSSASDTFAFRVILDHLRAATFLIADGVIPSNKDQGYFTRRLIRRAVRFGKNLGIKETFITAMGQAVVDTYAQQYPSLQEKSSIIHDELLREEEKFLATLTKGEKEFEQMFVERNGISGEDAFVLYSTYGFPLELTEEMAQEKGQHIDREMFQTEFKKHKDLSRAGSEQKFAGGLADHSQATVRLHTATHMLHQALRKVLGEHVFQKGSNITPERLRFDFSHPDKLTEEQLKAVEDLVNEHIQRDLTVHFEILDLVEAKSRGAIGVFDDKYAQLGGKIKVYFIGDDATADAYSKEVCGGPHVKKTAELGHFVIQKEESVGSGVRRIKAVLE